ncbi:MAG: hypothetical protein CMI54_02780 [Parcubacteria group bacterium]|nr:hypothetical protein [Parcubacteria group bacterium]
MAELSLRIREEGRIAELTRARKYHRCSECQELIEKGSQYYAITIGGSGLGSIKFPSRVHRDCLTAYFERVKRSRKL